MNSEIGEMTWNAHKHMNVRIAENQAEWNPLQRNFLFLAAQEHEPDPPDTPSVPNNPRL